MEEEQKSTTKQIRAEIQCMKKLLNNANKQEKKELQEKIKLLESKLESSKQNSTPNELITVANITEKEFKMSRQQKRKVY